MDWRFGGKITGYCAMGWEIQAVMLAGGIEFTDSGFLSKVTIASPLILIDAAQLLSMKEIISTFAICTISLWPRKRRNEITAKISTAAKINPHRLVTNFCGSMQSNLVPESVTS
jgi:hypothetical protein